MAGTGEDTPYATGVVEAEAPSMVASDETRSSAMCADECAVACDRPCRAPAVGCISVSTSGTATLDGAVLHSSSSTITTATRELANSISTCTARCGWTGQRAPLIWDVQLIGSTILYHNLLGWCVFARSVMDPFTQGQRSVTSCHLGVRLDEWLDGHLRRGSRRLGFGVDSDACRIGARLISFGSPDERFGGLQVGDSERGRCTIRAWRVGPRCVREP